MRQPMHELVAELRRGGFAVVSATRELDSEQPVLKIVAPDRQHSMYVWESDYFADPDGLVMRLRMQLRQLGYET